MSASEKWFHRGKELRANGRDRAILDGRLSPESRRQFLAGWDEQDRLMRKPTDDQVAESIRVAGKLRDFARELKGAK